MKGYPSWFSFKIITLVMLVLILTGYFLIPTTLELRLQWEVPWRLDAENRILIAAIHSLFAFLVFGLFGALWSIHMRQEWKKRKNRLSGGTLALSILFLVITGVGIYYLSNENFITLTTVSHLIVGVLVSVIYFCHSLMYKK